VDGLSADIAFQHKGAISHIPFKVSAETMIARLIPNTGASASSPPHLVARRPSAHPHGRAGHLACRDAGSPPRLTVRSRHLQFFGKHVSVTGARAFARLLGAAGQPANGLSTANARWGPVRHAGVGHVGAAAGTPHRGRARQSSRAMSAFRRAHSPKRRLIRSSPSAKSIGRRWCEDKRTPSQLCSVIDRRDVNEFGKLSGRERSLHEFEIDRVGHDRRNTG
jgi:hypothetical protein